MGAIHVLQKIVDRHDVGAGQSAGHPEKMRDVDQITLQAFENGAKLKIALGSGAVVEQRNGLEVRGERTDFRYLLWGANQEILIAMIEAAEGANDVASISADAELGDAPDVDGDLHGSDLTTESTGGHREIQVPP